MASAASSAAPIASAANASASMAPVPMAAASMAPAAKVAASMAPSAIFAAVMASALIAAAVMALLDSDTALTPSCALVVLTAASAMFLGVQARIAGDAGVEAAVARVFVKYAWVTSGPRIKAF